MDLNEVRKRLESRQDELTLRLQRVSRHTRHRKEPIPQDFAEQASELENQEVLEALDGEIVSELKKIKKALTRLDDEVYTICRVCGENIPVARLDALPFTDLCINCAQEQESY